MGRTFEVANNQTVLGNIQKKMKSLYAAEARVAQYISANPLEAVQANISELAERSSVSDATVVRCCKRLGYSGFYQMKLQLSHDLGTQHTRVMNTQTGNYSLQDVFTSMADRLHAIGQSLDEKTVRQCAEAINHATMVHIIGAGHSQILANDMIFRMASYGIRVTGARNTRNDICNLMLGDQTDVLVCISRSGETRQTIQAMKVANRIGMRTIAITAVDKSPLSVDASYALSCGGSGEGSSTNLYMMAVIDAIFAYLQNQVRDPEYLEELIAGSRL